MSLKNTLLPIGLLFVIALALSFFIPTTLPHSGDLDSTPQNATLSGTYVCLPHLDTSGPQTEECAFGLQVDDVYYAVNFGASAEAMNQFQSGAHITAEGFIVPRVALSTDQWAKYNMSGVFTVTRILNEGATPDMNTKLNINVVCESALSYMTFTDGASADAFVAECKEGKHPEVIEHYKAQMGLGDGAAI